MQRKQKRTKGFTLIELIVVIGIISILSSAVIVAVNPARQFKLARDSKRTTDVNAILNAVDQNMSEHGGIFYCDGLPTPIPSPSKVIGTAGLEWDGYTCVIPDYLSNMPIDPQKPGAYFTDETAYSTGYSIGADSQGRVTVSATSEVDPTKQISVTR